MVRCNAVEFKTSKGFSLVGLWYGPRRAKRAVIFVHGLAGSAFGRLEREISQHLTDRNTAALAFNNRGHDVISKLYKDDPRSKKGYKSMLAGGGREVFVECADDIQGAINFVKRNGARDIYLVGHSTGCQKSAYWAYATKGGRGVRGIIMLAPMSDYAAAVMDDKNGQLARATRFARALVRGGKKHEMLPGSIWPQMQSAQRFLSLFTPNSVEEIFSYAQLEKNPRVLKSVRAPTMVLLAEKDEYGDRPAAKIAAWFDETMKNKYQIVIIRGAKHSFKDAERQVA